MAKAIVKIRHAETPTGWYHDKRPIHYDKATLYYECENCGGYICDNSADLPDVCPTCGQHLIV